MGVVSSENLLRRAMTSVAFLTSLLLLLGATDTPGPTPSPRIESEEWKLEQVRKEIERLESLLENIKKEEQTLLGELHVLDLDLALQNRQLQVVKTDLARCRDEIDETEKRVDDLRSRLEKSREALGARLRVLYMSGPPVFERVVLTAQKATEVIEAYRLASLLTRSDAARIDGYRSDLRELREALTFLEDRQAELASLKQQTIQRRRQLERNRKDRTRLLRRIRDEAQEQQRALEEVAETEQALQRLMEGLASGGTIPPDWRVGFSEFRGLLPWPVPGEVLVPFGVQKDSRYNTGVPHPGITLSVELGEPVLAVFDGVVAFSDWFKGYGNLVILEHGEGFMSIYGHTSERLVATGDQVVGGQAIARAGDTGSLVGPRLYFEIWRGGEPEHPLRWLTLRSPGEMEER